MAEYTLGTIAEFKTAQFTVIVDAVEEFDLDLSWDEDGATARGLESGELIAFAARARVFHDTLGELARDYLGDCVYESLQDFRRSVGTCTDLKTGRVTRAGYCGAMVRTACDEARKRLRQVRNTVASIYVRES
jgi:hypothetical protein